MELERPSVRGQAYRKLRHSPHYHGLIPDFHYFDSDYAKKEYPVQLDLNEHLVGVYENKFGEKVFELPPKTKIWDTIVITSQALNLCYNGKCEDKVYLKDIVGIDGPENKIDDLVVHINLEDRVIDLAILYSSRPSGNPKDAFSWWNFLRVFSKPPSVKGSDASKIPNRSDCHNK